MRKFLFSLFILFALLLSSTTAQVMDAFQGILPVTDPQMKRSLNGVWDIKVVEGITDDLSVPIPDETWSKIDVPGCWEAYGLCTPTYHHADSLTGYYRTTFSIPEAWRGLRIVLRLDGVLYGYDLWINGQRAGSWRSGYNTALFDITPYLNKKVPEQHLAMRVITVFPGSDFDYNDDWAPSGIFRDVTLMAVPQIHLSDLTIHARLNGEVEVKTEVANARKSTVVEHEILDTNGQAVGTTKVENPKPWTAETPYLYILRTKVYDKGILLQMFEHKFGFRELTIDGNMLKLNGRPIKLRGVTSHSTDPKTVKVIDEASILRDMRLMKEASINYIRTSHYPREPRFYELADSLGFYVIDEVPFGYGDKNLSNPTFYPVIQQRAQATIRRDKNHASVLIWSLGNENPLTDICVQLGDYVKRELDPVRPICYPQVGSYFRRFNYDFPKVADIYAPHYPSVSHVADFFQRSDRPVIFTEYTHTLGISFEDHDKRWEIIERTPCIAGGSVWEWVDQGMPFKDALKDRYGYEERVFTSPEGGFEMCGNQGTDGLLYADRTPLPNYYELQHNYARAFVSEVKGDELGIVNRYDFINLKDNVTLHWTLTNDRDTVMRGAFSPDCKARSSTRYRLTLPQQNGLSLLQFDIEDAQGHVFLHQSFVLNKPNWNWQGSGDPMSLVQKEPMVRVGRKPTMCEMLKLKDRRIEKYLQPLDNPYVKTVLNTIDEDNGLKVEYTFTPDTSDTFLSELGIAFLLDERLDRVQWIGQGPLPSYPGRDKANRYGFWAKHMDDLYFEGNRLGVEAALISDAEGNGLLIAADSMNLNFEQTDRGIVLSVNAAVSGQGPKSSVTDYPVIAKTVGSISGSFFLYRISKEQFSQEPYTLFINPADVPLPFQPFLTQYDTYLMHFDSISQ
ncbi:MAG: hypothetical protein J5543_03240 [Bacteroidales bacterium]|jgi:beta-galactosidase|nr:hypothetical protein [Bacteroidales bacterium]